MKNTSLILLLSIFTTACDAIFGTYDESIDIVTDQMEVTADYWEGVFAKTDLCAVSEDDFFNFAGGAAVGTQLTAMLAGDSTLIVLSSGGVLVVTTPAVTTGATFLAGSAAVTYAGIKAYCGHKERSAYQKLVGKTAEVMCAVTGNC